MSELTKGLLDAKGRPRDLGATARATAKLLFDLGVDPASVDIVAEHTARIAEVIADASVGLAAFVDGISHTAPPSELVEAIAPAFDQPLAKAELAALAVHLVDIAELMAFSIYVPELPNISAKADRSGGAARSAGVAKRLRG